MKEVMLENQLKRWACRAINRMFAIGILLGVIGLLIGGIIWTLLNC